ncbi:MAG: DNA translocase FtsK [Gemmatimonadetes bacterium]|nr:DNA translocase FtsK [Gemmatimonadota bacterium]
MRTSKPAPKRTPTRCSRCTRIGGSPLIDPRTKDDLRAIAALLAGAFLALATLPPPVSVTGPAGVAIGGALREWFGLGAAAFPLVPLFWAVALFGHFERSLGKRVTVLLLGLALTVPFTAGAIYQYTDPAARALLAQHQPPEHFAPAGLVGLFLAYYLRVVGPIGEGLLALGAFSALTVSTVGWNPLGRLKKRQMEAGEAEPGGGAEASTVGAQPGAAPGLSEPAEDVFGEGEEKPAPRPKGTKKPKLTLIKGGEPGSAPAELLPPIELLNPPTAESANFESELDRQQQILLETLRQFKVEGTPSGRTTGPVVTQFEIVPAPGVKVGRIAALADDLALAMKAQSVRIVAPIPGKGAVGVEVPNPTPRVVGFRELLETPHWESASEKLFVPIVLGRNLEGRPIIADLAKMPHLLIAGATGSGKSVCINAIVTSFLYRYTPTELKMIMIDPKMVELSMYNALPHLLHSVVTDNRDAAKVLKWAVWEMQDRYELLHANGARNLVDFNRKFDEGRELKTPKDEPYQGGPLPYIVLIVDELADLIMTVQAEVETPLAQLAQKARAIGIHLILATQRPSVNVITGLIKANFPSRIGFRVASKIDSRTILDQNGAEALLGNGDMLFMPPGKSDLIRIQGAFIATEETERLMHWFDARREERIAAAREEAAAEEEPFAAERDILAEVDQRLALEEGAGEIEGGTAQGERDPLFRQAAEICIQNQKGSTSLLQRRLGIGYGRAARIIDQLYDAGILGPEDGSKPREVLVGLESLDRIIGE